MKKLMFPVFCSLFLGVVMGYYLFHEYDSTVKIKPVFQETSEKVYFFQLGVYSDLESVQNSTRSFTNYIYALEDSQYHVYVALTKSSKNVEKIKCSSCTFENKMVFTFTSILNDNNIEKGFYNFLKEKGINVEIESNGVLDDISKEN